MAFIVSCLVLPVVWEGYGTSKGLEGLCGVPFAIAVLVFFSTRKLYATEERKAEIEYVQAVSDWKHRWICLRCGADWRVVQP